MTIQLRTGILLFCLIGLLDCISSASADESTKQQFLTQYPKSAKIWKDRWEQCSGSFRLVSVDKKFEQDPYTAQFSRSHGFEKFELAIVRKVDGGQIDTTTVYCAGDNGSFFCIEKPHDKQKYRVGSITANDTEREMHEIDFARCIRAPLGGYHFPLIAMQEQGTLTVIDANSVAGQSNLIEVIFAVSDDTPLKQLVVRFDTNNHWAVVDQSYFVGSPAQKKASYHVDYGEKHDGIAFPVRFQASDEKSQYEFGEWNFGESPRSAFSLTNYGLPDLIEAKRANQRFGVFQTYLIIGILVSSLLGLMLFWLSKRSSKVNLS